MGKFQRIIGTNSIKYLTITKLKFKLSHVKISYWLILFLTDGVSIQGTCMELVCGFGGECKEQNGRAYCDCSNLPCLPKDHKNSAVVCGSDGRTYQSECQLQRTSCEQQTHLYMHHLAPCHNGRSKWLIPFTKICSAYRFCLILCNICISFSNLRSCFWCFLSMLTHKKVPSYDSAWSTFVLL